MEIVVYLSKNCGYCHHQKAFLQENGIVFEERDIAEKKYLQELMDLGGSGTPFTLINENGETVSKINGFNRAELNKLLLT